MSKGAWESLTCDIGTRGGSTTSATFAIPIGGLGIIASSILTKIGSPRALPLAFSLAFPSALAVARQLIDALREGSCGKFLFIEQLIRLCYRVSDTRSLAKVTNRLL